ncbi:MAG: hypothetical protein IIC08_02415, partial [Proteobacteria bacterium]|nr:hypothetical protein [Pseudomonadota bacterium]
MSQVKPCKFDSDGFRIEFDDALDDLTINSLTVDSGIVMGSSKVTGLADGTVSTDAVNKGQLDSLAAGFDRKQSCRVRTVLDLSGYTEAGSGATKTLTAPTNATSHNDHDGVTLVVGNRVLVPTAGDASDIADSANGIYEVTVVGDGATVSFELTRTEDANVDAEFTAGLFTFVTEGSAHSDTGWFITTNDPITIDTTAVEFGQFAGVGTFTGGDGIGIASGVISVDLEAAGVGTGGLAIDTGELRVDTGDGIELTATGVAADLEAAGAGEGGLAFDAGEIRVNVDVSEGLALTAAGLAAKLAAAGAGTGGLAFVSNEFAIDPDIAAAIELTASGVAINLEASSPSLKFSSNEIGVKFDGSSGLTKDAGGLQVVVDDTTIQINGSNQLEVIGGGAAAQYDLTAGAGGVTIGDPIYVSANDTGLPIDNASNNARKYVGVAAETVAAAATFALQQEGLI